MTDIEKLEAQLRTAEMEKVIENIYAWETEEQLKAKIRDLKAENEQLKAKLKETEETYTNTLKKLLKNRKEKK
jgi:hypothetical protein